MQRLIHIIRRLVVLLPCPLLVGCANDHLLQTTTQGTGTQGTPAQGATTCASSTRYIAYAGTNIGLKPGASFTFSAGDYGVGDCSVTWSIKEGPAGGIITDGGLYTAPSVEGVYHIIATSKASPSLSATDIAVVTATEFTAADRKSVV